MILLRAAFLAPALADFFLAAQTIFALGGEAEGSIVPSLRFAGVATAWGVFLLMGSRAPLERAWILWPTMLAVALVSLSALPGHAAGEMSAARLAFSLVLGGALILLCIAGLSSARRLRRDARG